MLLLLLLLLLSPRGDLLLPNGASLPLVLASRKGPSCPSDQAWRLVGRPLLVQSFPWAPWIPCVLLGDNLWLVDRPCPVPVLPNGLPLRDWVLVDPRCPSGVSIQGPRQIRSA